MNLEEEILNNSYGLIRSNQTKEKCDMRTGLLFKEITD